ncbi:MAG: sulfatase-like hydrolase/transferase [Planctomycetota bacterium]
MRKSILGAESILSRALPALALLLAACAGDRAPLSGVLVTLDTTRADALGCYGGGGATPHLDAFAAEAVTFTGARSVAPITQPAHASMLTGLYPPRHTVRTNGLSALPAAAETIAERARARGFATAAFLAAAVLDPPYGLAQGFDVYDTPAGTAALSTAHMVERADAEVARAAIRWLQGRDRKRPFFLWVHFFAPHAPYEPPPPFRPRGPGLREAYLGEVAALDDAFGALLAALAAEHGKDELLVVVAGDHGEGLADHGEETHTILVYEELLAVPLLVRRPGGAGAGTRVPDLVSVADVFPTLLAGLGLGAPGDVDGVDLFARPAAGTRGVYFESFDGYLNYGWCPLAGWMDARGKYVHGTNPELFDLAADRGERRNLFAAPDADAARYRDALAALDGIPPLAAGEETAIGEEERAALRALGYAAAAAATTRIPRLLEPTGLPDPRTRLPELAEFQAAVLSYNDAAGRGDRSGIEAAIERMTRIADRNPLNCYAAGVLGSYLYRHGRAEEAIRRLQALPDDRRDRPNTVDTLGHCFEHLGALEPALLRFERALELKPGDPHQLQDVIRVLEKLGRPAEAAPYRALLPADR